MAQTGKIADEEKRIGASNELVGNQRSDLEPCKLDGSLFSIIRLPPNSSDHFPLISENILI